MGNNPTAETPGCFKSQCLLSYKQKPRRNTSGFEFCCDEPTTVWLGGAYAERVRLHELYNLLFMRLEVVGQSRGCNFVLLPLCDRTEYLKRLIERFRNHKGYASFPCGNNWRRCGVVRRKPGSAPLASCLGHAQPPVGLSAENKNTNLILI